MLEMVELGGDKIVAFNLFDVKHGTAFVYKSLLHIVNFAHQGFCLIKYGD